MTLQHASCVRSDPATRLLRRSSRKTARHPHSTPDLTLSPLTTPSPPLDTTSAQATIDQKLQAITQQLETMDITGILTQDVVQLKAEVVSNEKDDWELRKYISDVAIDIVALAPEKLKHFLIADDRKNMALISIVAMNQLKAFAIGAPNSIAQFLMANQHTTIECEDGNTIQITFDSADAAASGNKGSFLWAHISIGAFDPTQVADLKTATADHMKNLSLGVTRFKPITDKVANTWKKKIHVDLKILDDARFTRQELSQIEFSLPEGMKGTVNWGRDMRKHFGICMGICSRVIKYMDYDEDGTERPRLNKSNCQCKTASGAGTSRAEERRKADAIWDRRMKKKKASSEGAGPSSG